MPSRHGELTASHRFVLDELMRNIEEIETRIARFDARLLDALQSVFKSKFQSLLVRRGYKRAIVALGHKILRTIFFMLKRHEYYRDSATDYEALAVRRNAPHWIRALNKFGSILAST